MNVNITTSNLELTDETRQFVDEKLADVTRAFGRARRDPITANVELAHTAERNRGMDGARPYRAEATISVPGGILRAVGTADTLRQAVVEMKHTLTRQVREWRARQRDARLRGARQAMAELAGPAPGGDRG